MRTDEWLRKNEHLLEAAWERLFVEAVLSRVDGLDFEHVRAQVPFKDGSGRERRLDFAIDDGQGAKIAIEVMGLQATPVSQRDFANDSRKAIALVTSGWVYLPIANSVFGGPSRADRPVERSEGAQQCAAAIAATIASMRSARAAEALNNSLRARIAATEADITVLKNQRAEAEVAKARAQAEAERLRASQVSATELLAVERQTREASRLLDRLNTGISEASTALEEMRRTSDAVRSGDGAAPPLMPPPPFRSRETSVIPWLVVIGLAVGSLVAGVAILRCTAGDSGDDESTPTARVTQSAVPMTPPPSSTALLTLQSLSSPVEAGGRATLRLLAEPRSECEIEYITPAGTSSNADGLIPRSADSRGNVSWTWTIGSSTAPGAGTVRVRCGTASGEWSFQITRP